MANAIKIVESISVYVASSISFPSTSRSSSSPLPSSFSPLLTPVAPLLHLSSCSPQLGLFFFRILALSRYFPPTSAVAPGFLSTLCCSWKFVAFSQQFRLSRFVGVLMLLVNCGPGGWLSGSKLGFRGLGIGFFYVFKKRWILHFPIIQYQRRNRIYKEEQRQLRAAVQKDKAGENGGGTHP
nr:NADH dehydrogenase [ubiquinone] iron-sulfur protein 5-B-like [Ipomoea batatas]